MKKSGITATALKKSRVLKCPVTDKTVLNERFSPYEQLP
ncbi:hypothetical protein SAMN05421579_10937 [Xenorhabdus japonica]|uniref:Uncharacterized protein n=1 Tax=Xenorhabdus japonica TaxID=53341 RepID=A0A1I5A2E0_9GAMM|nr:hypothetical protein SAMN05421579_10937 [Xenorhabdus japonica]